MIQLREDIAWVRQTDDRQQVLLADRLAGGLAAAAARAGHADWWLAEPIAMAIHRFICDEVAGRVVGAEDLCRLVTEALLALGQEDVAMTYRAGCDGTEIRLDQLVTESGGGFELAFFRQLDVALTEATGLVRLRGLRSCVMRLRGTRHWSAGCRQLAEEIIGHIRRRLTQQAKPVQVQMGD